jgi:signal transduction histidine kinase
VRAFEDEVRDGRRAPEEIGGVLAEALGDPRTDLRFWLPGTEAFADASGEVSDLPDDDRARTDIDRDGVPTAVLLHDQSLLDRRDLLHGVLAAAALSIEMARLRVEVRLQLAEVEASRVRIVEAGYEERRRLERDLHDGAQQRLVSLGVQVRRLQRTLPRGAAVLSPALDRVVDEIGAAIGDLRQIAAGVRPARLDDGLSAALADLARTAPMPVDVDVPLERVHASVEAAAYFVACEALTNAVRYASASRVSMRAVRENGTLLVSVTDDGIGGAVVRRGSGLAGLQDRVAAHGGTLEVVSPRGRGTRIEVAIPCDS